jgi:hypothetical protein
MRNYLKNTALLFTLTLLAACDKELIPADHVNITPGTPTTGSNGGFDIATQTLVSQGIFKEGNHPTSGIAKLYRKANTYTLVFDSFKTDEGPDLRIYLAQDIKAKNFIELAELKHTGNFYLTLPDNADVNNRTQVLIWCKRFGVLFGSAELTVPAQM